MSGAYGLGASGTSPPLYIGASMHAKREVAERYNVDLIARGFTVVSTWATRDETEESDYTIATRDFDDINRAGVLVVIVDPPSSSGGLATEMGIFIGRRLPVYVVGRSRNVFDALATKRFATWDDFLAWLDAKSTAAMGVTEWNVGR